MARREVYSARWSTALRGALRDQQEWPHTNPQGAASNHSLAGCAASWKLVFEVERSKQTAWLCYCAIKVDHDAQYVGGLVTDYPLG